MITFKLSGDWDLVLGQDCQLATARSPHAVAQSVSNAVRLFTQDAYLDQQDGIPHFDIELGHSPSADVVKERIIRTALTVAEVDAARITIYSVGQDRVARGEMQIETMGVTVNATF